MRFALHLSNHFFQILFTLIFMTLFAVLLSECPSLGQSSAPVAVEGFGSDVPNMMEAREQIYTGGQPTMEGLRRLASFGIRTVVNLRPHDESGARDETPEATALGMKYINVPLTRGSFTMQKIEDIRCLMKDKQNYPLFIHCGSGNRAGGTWFVYRALYEHASIQQGLLEGRALGMEPALEPVLIEFLRDAKQQTPKEICQERR